MADTIEWLETIGKNAKLRHAAAEELVHTLAQAGASDALKVAVASGDRSALSVEFGHKPMKDEHSTTGPGHEEEPDHDGDKHVPTKPHKPDHDRPSRDR
ncbi:hypothetical protein [Dyella choica]|uniref:hypothetical protein n=1 Tax=Dyella choica TaxID=1927959 RepID=UPI0018AD3E8C|nr:hypothetical protein [Dyella choica]